MLHWLERARESGESDLLLAPISAQGDEKNRMAAYLQRLDQARRRFEDSRLLYVAATRAKQRLHLLGHVGVQEPEGGVALPHQDSLLARLWPVVESDFQSLLDECKDPMTVLEDAVEPAVHTALPTRLASDWSLPAPPESVQVADNTTVESGMDKLVEFDWAGETARHVGTVVHRLLQQMGKMGIDQVGSADLRRFEQVGRNMLMRLGVPGDRLNGTVEEIGKALQAALNAERGQWILGGQHQDARCELALSGVRDGHIDHMVIDRTFVDEHGARWIIDYKTGIHSGGGIDEFLDREQERYRGQLERYAGIMSKMEQRPIRLGLYFPLLGGWREWSF